MELPFRNFPYSKSTYVHVVYQLPNPDTSLVFTDELNQDHLEQILGNKVNFKNLILATGVSEINSEGDHTQYIQKTISNYEKLFPNLENIYLLYNTVYCDHSRLFSSANITPISLHNYFFLRSTLTDLSQFKIWDGGDKKAIYLPGDIRNRPHKFSLIYYFYLKNNLNLLHYSLPLNSKHGINEDIFQERHFCKLIPIFNEIFQDNLDIEQFRILSEKFHNTLDEEYITGMVPFSGPMNVGTQLFPKEWNIASCNIIAETTFENFQHLLPHSHQDRKFFFSEKVWKPILSGKPFIAISEGDNIYSQLEELGFRTFLEYTDFKEKLESVTLDNYPLSEVVSQHLKICYDRTVSFIVNIEKYKNEILSDTLYNLNRWKQLGNESWKHLRDNCPPIHSMSDSYFCEMFDHCSNVNFTENWLSKT